MSPSLLASMVMVPCSTAQADSAENGQYLPMALRGSFGTPLPDAGAGHLRGHAALIEKDQSLRCGPAERFLEDLRRC
jgi:hypothetical protein